MRKLLTTECSITLQKARLHSCMLILLLQWNLHFYKKVIRKLKTKWLINMTFLGNFKFKKMLHFRRTLVTFIEERRDMRRKLFVDTILNRIRSIIALIPQFVYPSVQKNRWVESTDQVQTVTLTGRSDNLWHNNVFMFQTERESPSCLNTPWI